MTSKMQAFLGLGPKLIPPAVEEETEEAPPPAPEAEEAPPPAPEAEEPKAKSKKKSED